MDAGQSYETEGTAPAQSGARPPPYSTANQTTPLESTADAPPNYQTAIQTPVASTSSERDVLMTEVDSADIADASTLTIEGRQVVSLASPQVPFYTLSHELDGYELNATGIMLTRIQKAPRGKRSIKVKRRDVFALRDTPIPANYQIDGERFLSGKKGHMSKQFTKTGPGWSAGGKNLPSFGLRPVSLSSGTRGRGYEWRDKTTDKVIAVETRRSWDKKNKTELTRPKLELKLHDDYSAEYFDFLVAVWCMHNWREAKDITKEPLTWEEFKEQAKTTARNTKTRRWNLGAGALGAAAM